MGHQGNDMGWGDDLQKRKDFAERGVHATAMAAKALIHVFYGQASRYSYFTGCSDGGREALIEAQRYPGDFNGIAAGAPALAFAAQNSFHHTWLARANTDAQGQAILLAADLAPLHAAALKACDGLDGLVDGQITDPRACHVDPSAILCKGAYEPGQCLTAAKVEAARLIYQGARDENGKPLEIGATMPGSELNWVGVFVPTTAAGRTMSGMIAMQAVNHLLFAPNPVTPWTMQTFPFTEAMAQKEAEARKLYNADDANLAPFAAYGGKLILYHGWADPHISPLVTLDYFHRVGVAMTPAKRDAMLRLFLLPGMAHCSGGDGPSEFPLLATLMNWVEGARRRRWSSPPAPPRRMRASPWASPPPRPSLSTAASRPTSLALAPPMVRCRTQNPSRKQPPIRCSPPCPRAAARSMPGLKWPSTRAAGRWMMPPISPPNTERGACRRNACGPSFIRTPWSP
jgi:feruloyl esterase